MLLILADYSFKPSIRRGFIVFLQIKVCAIRKPNEWGQGTKYLPVAKEYRPPPWSCNSLHLFLIQPNQQEPANNFSDTKKLPKCRYLSVPHLAGLPNKSPTAYRHKAQTGDCCGPKYICCIARQIKPIQQYIAVASSLSIT